jgi:activating signal cointegrator complex subunit 3
LEEAGCVEVDEDGRGLYATVAGRLASFYYLSHKTLALFQERLTPESSVEQLLKLLTDVQEYDELPVRHNEDLQNA